MSAAASVYPARTIVVTVRRDWREVYAFAADPDHWPLWAAGLGTSFVRSGDEWTADDPEGRKIRFTFSPSNTFGVLDHVVCLPDGTTTSNAFRVVPNGTGAELMFTVLRMHETSEEAFEADCAAVERDLNTLRELLER